VGDKISIGEARARRTDPVWRRLHKTADLMGMGLVALVVLVPAVLQLLVPPYGAVVAVAVLLGTAVAVAGSGPKVGFERRAALLLGIPLVNLLVLVPAVWRAAHLHLQRWQGPLEPRIEDQAWVAASVVGGLCWLATLAGVALLVASGA
jgi:hypothetical protein